MGKKRKMSKVDMALAVFNPDPQTGISRIVTKEEMVKAYPELNHANGWDWGRYDGPLAKKFELKTFPDTGGPITAYQLIGFSKTKSLNKKIRKDIRDIIKSQPCVVTGVYANGKKLRIECDHKNGRYNDPQVNEVSTQSQNDFQPLHKNVNTIKREHCKSCEITGKRYDAKKLGFTVSWIQGNVEHSGKSDGCVGCYWYDPRDFHLKVSSNFSYKQK